VSPELGSDIDALTLLGVTKVYGEDIVAVDTVDLEVRDREFLTILGPSGSGKTTVLKLIAGFTSPTSGQIRIDGRDVSHTPPHKRNLGMVFQNYALFPHLTVEENLAFPLEMRRVDRAEVRRRVGQVLDIVRLPGMGKRYPRQLSGGQQQRVALARAIVYEPRVLLMDEPLGALDKRLREDLQVEFKRLHQELGVTVVYVTHDQEEALLLSDRIAIFHNGRIEQVGTGEDLYRRPRSPFVGSFIGDSNVFRGVFELNQGSSGVRRDGAWFPGTVHPDADLTAGDSAVLIVRPESCVITPPDLAPSTSDRLTATVQQVIYLGSTVKYVLAYDGMTLYARLNPQHSDWRLEPGSRTVVQWAAEDAVIVPGD
jgi:spermidine/putrescine ABC transporter ATP-binding subunit